MTEMATSADGTTVAYDVSGCGLAVVIVCGAFHHGGSTDELARLLSADFTVYAYDRRGRGDSADTLPYSVNRELDDLATVIAAAGGEAMVYGHSSGAILSLLGAAAGLPITKLVAYEPSWTFDPSAPPRESVLPRVRAALAAGDRETAAELFMGETGMPPAGIERTKTLPFWPAMVAIAPTTEYDLVVVGDARVPEATIAKIGVSTLLIDGGISPPWAARAADAAAAVVPNSQRLTLEGQHHGVDQVVLAPLLAQFFGERTIDRVSI